MRTVILSGCEADEYPFTGVYVNFTHDRSLFREVNGIIIALDLQDHDGDTIGLIESRMTFDEGRDLANKLLNIIGERR